MASDRDTLAELVIGHWSWRDRRDKLQCSCPSAHWVTNDDPTAGPGAHGWAEHVAEALISAGVRPPAREISDAAELDTLPPFSVVLAYGVSHQSVPDETSPVVWIKPFGSYTSAELLTACRGAGVTVLYEPVDEDDDCPHDSRSGADGRWRCDQCDTDCGPDTYLTPTEEKSRG
ncbi:hypothetical protein ACFWPK_34495 [Nocardia sp. NPDC058519]|uniref:hypothetical protein n=1 Tax=Nocardia sp. NPDC058519 TaxID=3346535 RepID=UPI0036690C30